MFGFKKDFTFKNGKKTNNKSHSNYKKKKNKRKQKKNKTHQPDSNPALQI